MITTVLLDVDGVLVDLATPVWRAAQALIGRALTPPERWAAYDFAKAMTLTQSQATRLYNMLRKEDNLASQALWYPGAIQFVHELLRYGFDVCFVTKPWDEMPSWQKDRKRQLREHFPRQGVLFISEKHRVLGHHLIDDCVDHIRRDPYRGFLFDQPWNRTPEAKGYRRVTGYEHALKRIMFGELYEETEITELGCGAECISQVIATAPQGVGSGGESSGHGRAAPDHRAVNGKP